MLDKIRDTINTYRMFQKRDKVIVALSAGPDSVCLLHILLELQKDFGFKLHLAHLNHGTRREGATDANYARRLSRKVKIPITVVKRDIPKMAKEEGGSIEMAARKIRYQFLAEVAKEVKATKIALGHTQDDQIETFLLNFLRGAGTVGLSGMPAKRKMTRIQNRNIYIIRPLIRLTKREIINYLDKNRIHFRQDATNLQLTYRRNKIRWKLLPLLQKEYNSNVKGVIARMTRIFEEENIFWQNYLKVISKDIVLKRTKKEIQLDVKKLTNQAGAVQNRIIQLALKQFVGELKGFACEHIAAVRKLCQRNVGRKILNLPGCIQAVKNYQRLIFKRYQPEPGYFFEFALKSPGINSFSILASRLKVHLESCNAGIKKRIKKLRAVPFGERFKAIIDKDKISFPLILRNRHPGDKFQPLGFKNLFKLKKYFINKKISFSEREKIPLLLDHQGKIIWIIGFEIADWAKVTKATRKVVQLTYSTYG